MKTNIVRINPSGKRYKENGKELIKQACNAIDGVKNRVSGFAVLAWDDIGHTSIAIKTGGPVGAGIAPTFIHEKFTQLIGYED